MQTPYARPALPAPATWSSHTASAADVAPPVEAWWTALHDPAVDFLIDAALADSPTLGQAAARIDEARAALGAGVAQRLPVVSASAQATRARDFDSDGTAGRPTAIQSTGSAGLGLSWEVDLFGRVRHTVELAERRLDARNADAQGARLMLTSQVADTVLALRACEFSRSILAADAASREKTLALTRRRVATGLTAPVDESRAESGLAEVRTTVASRTESCARGVNLLVALTGLDAGTVRRRVSEPLEAVPPDATRPSVRTAILPTPPPVRLAVPAIVLASHPMVIAAERELAAAWADVGIRQAERLPKLDIAGLLAGQWLHAAGTSLNYTAWSLGASLSGTLFDGGRGAASVSAAQARYRAADASLRAALRSAAEDIENALAAIDSARARIATTQLGETAARRTLIATEAQWRAGAVSLFELEDARRLHASAQNSAIAAAQDSGRAWVLLVRASGNAAFNPENSRDEHAALAVR